MLKVKTRFIYFLIDFWDDVFLGAVYYSLLKPSLYDFRPAKEDIKKSHHHYFSMENAGFKD